MRRTSRGFTLVELLVVIGIIALLISILLPALSKARQQANTVACASNERQFYALMTLYANDYNQYVLPARITVPSAQYYWWSPAFVGQELGHNNYSNSTNRNQSERSIVQILTCPSANHTLDPAPANAGTGYWGDYTYNQNLGCEDVTTTPITVTTPFERMSEVPSNVLALTDIDKSWTEAGGGSETNTSMFLEPNYLLGTHTNPWTTGNGPNMWFPHGGNKYANMLFMDGHVDQVSANDMLLQPSSGSQVSINTTTVPWTYLPSASAVNGAYKGWLIGYYKAGATPLWQIPWNKFAPSL